MYKTYVDDDGRPSWDRLVGLVVGVVGLAILIVVWVKAPDAYRHAKDPASATAMTRTGIATAGAGLPALLGVMASLAEIRRQNMRTWKSDRRPHERELAARLAEHYSAAASLID